MNARYCIFITAVKQLCGTTLFIKLLWYKLKSAFFKHFQKKTIIIFEINFLKYVDFSWACSYCFLSMNFLLKSAILLNKFMVNFSPGCFLHLKG